MLNSYLIFLNFLNLQRKNLKKNYLEFINKSQIKLKLISMPEHLSY